MSMSLSSHSSQRVALFVTPKVTPSVWGRVVLQWMAVVGDSPDLLTGLNQQQELFRKLGITYQWFEWSFSTQFQVVGLKFLCPFHEVLTCFQSCWVDDIGQSHYSWHEVSESLYASYETKSARSQIKLPFRFPS